MVRKPIINIQGRLAGRVTRTLGSTPILEFLELRGISLDSILDGSKFSCNLSNYNRFALE